MANQSYSFCETVTASGSTPWHIRKLSAAGRKLGGGADTPALCGREVAWDLAGEITEQECMVDIEDLETVLQYRWYAFPGVNTFYAFTCRVGFMHQLLLQPGEQIVDHVDRNGLNNRRYNLRTSTKSLNAHNSYAPKRSMYPNLPRGVNRIGRRYSAGIGIDGRYTYLGLFESAREASRVVEAKRLELFQKAELAGIIRYGTQAKP